MIKEVYGKKIGMTQVFDEQGNLRAVTLLEIEPAYLIETAAYPTKNRVRVGFFKLAKEKTAKLKKPIAGYFNKIGIDACKLIREVEPQAGVDFSFLSQKTDMVSKKVGAAEAVSDKVPEDASTSEVAEPGVSEVQPEPGDKRKVEIDIFKEGDIIDARAKTKGKGFAGGMKRHGWSGQPKTHGSTTHRRIGSAGSSAYPSRIIKGLHMPGHLGNGYRTTKNLKVIKVDKDKNVLFLSGCIPGPRGAIVRLKKVN